jgi:hypothetical protein
MIFKIRVQLKEKPVKVDHGFPGSKCDWVFENPVAIPKKKPNQSNLEPWATCQSLTGCYHKAFFVIGFSKTPSHLEVDRACWGLIEISAFEPIIHFLAVEL